MALRKINTEAPENIQAACKKGQQPQYPKWESITCKLVTPMYGGGVESAIPDKDQPVRASAIRGQLRFWWRLLAKSKWQEWYKDEDWSQNKNISDEDLSKKLRQKEFELWGGMNDGGEDGKASLVFLKIQSVGSPRKIPYFSKWSLNKRERQKNNDLSPYSYVLFAMDNETECQEKTTLIDKGLTWELQWRLTDSSKQTEVIETLRWWANFGGLGARTRRGCGAFEVTHSSIPDIITPLTQENVQAAGCQLAFTNSTSKDAMKAWETAVERLRNFRQGEIGRNPSKDSQKAGRSRWPEPDAIRRITGCHSPRHKPEHAAGNQFPRGMFGMPIIFQFMDKNRKDKNIPTRNKEPEQTSLQPIGKDGKLKERMSSPVIIRPFKNRDGQWVAAALLLPYDANLSVKLKGIPENKSNVTLINPEKVNQIRPIQNNGGGNPLTAFMIYFQKEKETK